MAVYAAGHADRATLGRITRAMCYGALVTAAYGYVQYARGGYDLAVSAVLALLHGSVRRPRRRLRRRRHLCQPEHPGRLHADGPAARVGLVRLGGGPAAGRVAGGSGAARRPPAAHLLEGELAPVLHAARAVGAGAAADRRHLRAGRRRRRRRRGDPPADRAGDPDAAVHLPGQPRGQRRHAAGAVVGGARRPSSSGRSSGSAWTGSPRRRPVSATACSPTSSAPTTCTCRRSSISASSAASCGGRRACSSSAAPSPGCDLDDHGAGASLHLGLVLSAAAFFLYGLVETLNISNQYVNTSWLVLGLLAASSHQQRRGRRGAPRRMT